MAKSDSNFFRGWCRQARAALDEGTELGYEAAELIDELLGLIEPDGDSGREVELPDGDGSPSLGTAVARASAGLEQMHLPGVPGVAGDVGHTPGTDDGPAGVPRGTRGVPTAVVRRIQRR